MKYFSTFSGMGVFEYACQEFQWDCVGYSEIDKYAASVYKYHFPGHKNFGDITKINIEKLPDFDLLVGGSPCQDLSIAKQGREGLQGEKSKLFYKYLEILKIKKPRFFLLENVNSMSEENKNKISSLLGTQPIMINAALVSAQQRKRLFWCNWQVEQPIDRHIYLQDIIEDGYIEKEKKRQIIFNSSVHIGQIGKGGQGDRIYSMQGKSVCLSANSGGRGARTGLYVIGCAKRTRENKGKQLELRKDLKSNALTTVQTDSMVNLKDCVRKLTPVECERLQSLPDNFTAVGITKQEQKIKISNTQRYKMCGNAFNALVIRHLLLALTKSYYV